jgi:hypothetical protein
MGREKENAPIQSTVEGVFFSTQLVGTRISSTCARPDRRIPKNQFFQKEQRHYQLRIGLRNHDKTMPVTATPGLFIQDQGNMSSSIQQPFEGL